MIKTNSNRLALYCLILVNNGYLDELLTFSILGLWAISEKSYTYLTFVFLPEVAHMERSSGKFVISMK